MVEIYEKSGHILSQMSLAKRVKTIYFQDERYIETLYSGNKEWVITSYSKGLLDIDLPVSIKDEIIFVGNRINDYMIIKIVDHLLCPPEKVVVV